MALVDVNGRWGCKVEARRQHKIAQNKDTSSMVIALGFNICICHQKHGKDDNNNVPSRED